MKLQNPASVFFHDIRPGHRVGLFLQPRSLAWAQPETGQLMPHYNC